MSGSVRGVRSLTGKRIRAETTGRGTGAGIGGTIETGTGEMTVIGTGTGTGATRGTRITGLLVIQARVGRAVATV